MSAAMAWLAAGGSAAGLAALRDFVTIPSVSTDPTYRNGMGQAADWLVRHLRSLGFDHVATRATGGHPVVTADWLHAPPGAPTLLVYGHYDVQPPDPLDLWASPPFVPTERDGRLYARGVSDDKGPVLVALTAAAALIATGTLRVNLRLLLEGEEEVGSANLDPFVTAHAGELAADWVLSADGARWRADLPTLIVATRGICALEVTVRGAAKDLHSGRHGGMAPNPIQHLARLLAGLHDETGRVAVPGFYDRARPVTAEQRAQLAAIPFDEAAYAQSIGLNRAAGQPGTSALERNWLLPTLELNGITGGYAGPGGKTVIPAAASAKLTCRLVADQEPEEIAHLIAQDLRRRAADDVSVDVAIQPGHAHPSAIDPDHPGLVLAGRVLDELYGVAPLHTRMGATLPICGIFRRRLGLDTVAFSFATSDEDYHAPNEFFRLSSWDEGLRGWVDYLTRVSS
jgi:acetylornithine deacetylase/succinyl-diaminopimelate desuccinylase-like protein